MILLHKKVLFRALLFAKRGCGLALELTHFDFFGL